MIEVSVLVDKLNNMTCGEIREYLGLQGIKGFVHVSHECPIANWIYRESGCYVEAEDWVQVYDEDTEPLIQYQLAEGPMSFIMQFDGGWFPELIIPGSFGTEYDRDDDLLDQDSDVQG